MSRATDAFRKGMWVRYDRPFAAHGSLKIGEVSHVNRGLVFVDFIGGGKGISYGCYPQLLTKVYKRNVAVEIAKIALS